MKRILICYVLLILIGCSPKRSNPVISNDFLPGKKLSELTHKKLGEVSGLASSVANPGLFWALNDSGNDPEIFLIDRDLQIRSTYKLEGVKNRDWEDIAIGPGPDSTKKYIYVAEIGDNDAVHRLKYIYRFAEPVADSVEDASITSFETITFELPDKRRDTETLMINPGTGDLYIVSKREEPVNVYEIKFPYPTSGTITAQKVLSLPYVLIVAGAFSPDGSEIVMKNYNHIYYWANPSKKPVHELLSEAPREVPYEVEPQGESITWANDNSGFYTLSEKNKGKKSFLYFYERK